MARLNTDPLSVTLRYEQWIYLLGWMEAHRLPDESVALNDAIVTIAGTVRDAGR